jgi:hypothetical protein
LLRTVKSEKAEILEMSKPHEHALAGVGVLLIIRILRIPIKPITFLAGSILPDFDFFLFAPFFGRVKGHRTISHSPIFQVGLAWMLRRFGFSSLLGGMLLHSMIDNFTYGRPPGIAWLWPFRWDRYRVGRELIKGQSDSNNQFLDSHNKNDCE